MKKTLLTFFLALLIGSLFAIYVFRGIDKTFAMKKESDNVTLFQVGVFNNKDNAITLSQKYDWSIIMYDNSFYRVYIGIAKDKEVIQAYENYFKNININYYKRDISIPVECLTTIKKYEDIIKNSFSSDTYVKINKELLDYYLGGCHD